MGEGAERDHREGAARAGRIGRRAALALYLVGLLYITVVAFGSVVPQVFRSTASAEARAHAPASCDQGIRGLERALHERAQQVVGPPNAELPHPSLDAFFRTWDDDYRALADRCRGDAYVTLGRFRYQLEITLRRYEREDARLAREVEQKLELSR